MCGITGCYGFGDLALLRRMTDVIAHRGPDGEYHFKDGPVLLGNRRLAILDVAGGEQPMTNRDGSVVVVYNGEIYNFPELRAELVRDGYSLHTHCDTEIIPHLYDRDGLEFIKRLNGIFSIALWDRRKQTLYLIRDLLGIKPLLYAQSGGSLAFGSEAKAILASGLVSADLDPIALHYSMNVRYLPGTHTLFNGIRRLRPGHYLSISASGISEHRYETIEWAPDEQLTRNQCIDGIREHLEQSVNRQLLSDVPVGVSLSGGIDSSTIVAMIRRKHNGELRTFTLGFNEPSDENEDARFVSNRFGTKHEDLVLHEPAMSHLRDAIYFTEEPKVNCLQLYLLHRYIGDHVKVVLSGLGGDELFGGYDIYSYLLRSLRWSRYIPNFVNATLLAPSLNAGARLLSALAKPQLDLYARQLEWLASTKDGARQYLLLRNAWDSNAALFDRIYQPDFIARIPQNVHHEFGPYFTNEDVLTSVMRAEFNTKMVNDLLHNEDTMSMAHSVESRVPWLDIDFVRFAARIPTRIRFDGGMKGLLKQSLKGIIPEKVIHKKKWGFTVDPVEQFRKDLKPLAERLLLSDRFEGRRVFRTDFVTSILRARPQQRLRWHYFMLWQMIGFEYWCDLFLDNRAGG